MSTILPVVLSGGAGTRLWPLSRALFPKQFIRFPEVQPETFLAAAMKRLEPAHGFAPPLVVCNNDHRFLVKDEAERSGVRPKAIVLEPIARNTAPAVAVAALIAERADPRQRAGGHAVGPRGEGRAALRGGRAQGGGDRGCRQAGAVRHRARTHRTPGTATSSVGRRCAGYEGAFAVAAFTEKPSRETAAAYLAAGGYSWNSGIFVLGGARLPERAGAPRAGGAGCGQRPRSTAPTPTSTSCDSTPRRSPPRPASPSTTR